MSWLSPVTVVSVFVDEFYGKIRRYNLKERILVIKPTRSTNFSNLLIQIKFNVFRTVPLSIIRSFLMYTHQCYMSYRFVDILRAGSGRFSPDPARKLYYIYTIAVCTVENS